jgi:hypothetical protein
MLNYEYKKMNRGLISPRQGHPVRAYWALGGQHRAISFQEQAGRFIPDNPALVSYRLVKALLKRKAPSLTQTLALELKHWEEISPYRAGSL